MLLIIPIATIALAIFGNHYHTKRQTPQHSYKMWAIQPGVVLINGVLTAIIWTILAGTVFNYSDTESLPLAKSPAADYVTTTGYYVNGEDGAVELREFRQETNVRYFDTDGEPYVDIVNNVTPGWMLFFIDAHQTVGYDFYVPD